MICRVEPGFLASRLASCLPQQMWISKGEYELFFKVLIRHFLCSWQSAKTPGGGSFGHPRQRECLSHTPSTCHTCTTLVLSHSRTLSHDVLHNPLSGSSVNERCAQDTEQKHGKSHLMTSWKGCTNEEYESLRNSRPYWNWMTWRLIRGKHDLIVTD